jgi:hypothetical protein
MPATLSDCIAGKPEAIHMSEKPPIRKLPRMAGQRRFVWGWWSDAEIESAPGSLPSGAE